MQVCDPLLNYKLVKHSSKFVFQTKVKSCTFHSVSSPNSYGWCIPMFEGLSSHIAADNMALSFISVFYAIPFPF